MKQFTNLYPLSKTLRFELQPVGKTKENIEKAVFFNVTNNVQKITRK